MPLKYPDLAARTYNDILEEMVSSIPRYSEKWTNFNPADPGIMILEILAWIFDTNLYRMNSLPEESYMNFMRLIAGASGNEVDLLIEKLKKYPNSDKEHLQFLEFLKEIEGNNRKGQQVRNILEMKAAALHFLNSNYRAVTEDNFVKLAIESTINRIEGGPAVKRAIVSGNHDGKVEITIISDNKEKYNELIKIVKDYLEPRRLICTKIVVKAPVYSSIKIDIEAVCQPDSKPMLTRENIMKNIIAFLDPVTGGDEKKGWPYGRPVSIYELFHIIEETDGVDYAENVTLNGNPDIRYQRIEGLIGDVDISIKVEGEK